MRSRTRIHASIRLSWRVCLAAVCACVVHASEVAAQAHRVITNPASKAPTIKIEHVAEIGDSIGPGRLDPVLYGLARDSRGRVIVASGFERPGAVFDGEGRFLRAIDITQPNDTIPATIAAVFLAQGDTLHLIDESNLRRVVVTPDYKVVRAAAVPPLPHPAFALLLDDGQWLTSGDVHTRESIGLPLHRITTDGTVLRSFGLERAETVPGGELRHRRLAYSGDGGVWSGRLTQYRIERWTAEDEHDLTLERTAPWFTPYFQMHQPARDQSPQPMLMAVREDSIGRLWVALRVADRDWTHAFETDLEYTHNDSAQRPVRDLALLYDTIIEVLDPVCGRVLGSTRVPFLAIGFLDDNHFAEWRLTPAAPPRLGVWRAELDVQPSPKEGEC